MESRAGRLLLAILALFMGCATLDLGAESDTVVVQTPQTVDGDPHALAWPFHLVDDTGLRAFRLRLDAGGTLVAVRPDASNPDPAAPGWTGSVREGVAVWSGPPPARPVPLTILVRAARPGDQELRVRYTPEPTVDVSAWTCERWMYRLPEGRIERDGC
ncbi:MAG: hypothetical protein ACRELU_10110 [Gemmatimonadota bacterium]